MIKRIAGRRICRDCGAVYNIYSEFYPNPKKEGTCDICGGELYQRIDDNKPTVKQRLKLYNSETPPIIKKYENKLIKIDASDKPESTAKKIIHIINKDFRKSSVLDLGGVYILIINVKMDTVIKVGALGKIHFKKGNYAYLGSAQNNLKKRIQRHLSKNKKKRWHIDYLLLNPSVKIENIHYKKAGREEECKIAHMLGSFEEPIKGFGSSDCRCHSHLFRLKSLNYFYKKKFKDISNIEIEDSKITEKCR